MAEQQALTQLAQLQKEFASNNLAQCQSLISKLKVHLVGLSLLASTDNAKHLLLARELLEVNARVCLKERDVNGFERTMTQLFPYYFESSSMLAASQLMLPLLSGYMLHLLSQSRISEFHSFLERIKCEDLNNVYVKCAVKVEQSLMEGSYNHVWRMRGDIPMPEYAVFMDLLVSTIRDEVALCAETSYQNLPLANAQTMFYFSDSKSLMDFCAKKGWKVNAADKRVEFCMAKEEQQSIPAVSLIKKALGYARELERIV